MTYHIKASTRTHQHHCFLNKHFGAGCPSIFQVKWVHHIAWDAIPVRVSGNGPWKLFQTGTPFRDIYSCGARELRSFIQVSLTWPLDIIAWPFYRGVVKFLWQSQRPTESETWQAELGCLRAFFGPSTSSCSWIAMWEQQSFHGTSLICKSLNRWPATPSKPVSVVHLYNWQVKLLFNSALLRKNVPTGVIFDQIFKFKTLLEASSLEGYFSFEHQTWNDGMTDVHRPPTLTLRSRTGAAKPTLWPTLNPCHFTVPCFIYKTKTVSFSSKQALSNNVFGVKIGRTTTLRRLFKVINFRRSKFVCTLWPGPVFGMCAAGLATHLTTPVCPVARTQTIILQVVYSAAIVFSSLQGQSQWVSHTTFWRACARTIWSQNGERTAGKAAQVHIYS